jgi:uncharacterized delta-60 repeat protein
MSLFPIKCPIKYPMKLAALCLLLFTLFTAEFSAETFAAALDIGFGDNGKVAVDLGSYGDQANAVLVQPDGKILVGGSTANSANLDFMLFRLLADGSLDPEFNIDGKVSTAIGSDDDEVFALALQKDGRILAAGYSSKDGSRDFALARYNSDGSLDPDFGTGGMAVKSVSDSDDEITGVAVQPDGKILLTGTALKDEGRVVVVGRYRSDGTADDESFADKGFNLSAVGTDARAESLLLTQEGRILVAGTYSEKKENEQQKTALMVLAYDENGELDTTFGHKGVTVPLNGTVPSAGYGMTIRSDGSILVAGSVGENGERDGALFLFGEDGLPDTTFGEKGALVVDDDKDTVVYDVLAIDEMIAATGVTVGEDGKRKSLLVTYSKETNSELFQQRMADAESADDNTPGTPSDFWGTGGTVITTDVNNEESSASSLAVTKGGLIVAGVSGSQDTSSASVSKYTLSLISSTTSSGSSAGNIYVWTGEPVQVTRTTVLIPGEILEGFDSAVTKRGVVFSVDPFPVLEGGSSTDSTTTDDTATVDETAPSITASTKSTFSSTEEVILAVSTDEDAICRYNANYDEDYGEMSSVLSSSFGTGHHVVLGQLAAGSYTYYVRCKDVKGNINSSGDNITFEVKEETEKNSAEAPERGDLSPGGNVSGSSVTLSLTTDVAATCKYTDSGAGMDYSNMKKFFDETGETEHSESVSDLADGEYTYYVRCKNTSSGAANTTDAKITFTVDTTEIVVEITQSYFDPDTNTLSVTTDVAASCRYKKGIDVDYTSMNDSFLSTGATLHEVTLDALSDGTYTYYVRCENTATKEVTPVGTAITFTVVSITQPDNQATKLFASSSPMKAGLTTALESVGNLFVSTALAEEDTETTTSDSSSSSATASDSSSSSSSEINTQDSVFQEQGNIVDEGTGTGQFTAKLADLKPGTVFYARAYAVVNGTTYYGNQISFRTEDSCFVATAAYGSIFHPAVQLLRDFRDRFMIDNPAGRALVRLYYHYSPPVADMIRNSAVLRPMTRTLLMPIIGSAWLTMRFGWLWMLLPAAALVLLNRFGMRTMRKERMR